MALQGKLERAELCWTSDDSKDINQVRVGGQASVFVTLLASCLDQMHSHKHSELATTAQQSRPVQV